jgi:bacterioferritin (cytochrome b1)
LPLFSYSHRKKRAIFVRRKVQATGIHSAAVAAEFRTHAQEEQEHADRIARRIRQLGGKPQMHPGVIAQASHSEYQEGTSLADMIREDLVAERIAIETYGEIVNYFEEHDPTSRLMMEEILAKEDALYEAFPCWLRESPGVSGLLPVPRQPDPVLALWHPLPWHPGAHTLGREFPVSGYPLPAIIPGPVSRHPDRRRRGGHGHGFLA